MRLTSRHRQPHGCVLVHNKAQITSFWLNISPPAPLWHRRCTDTTTKPHDSPFRDQSEACVTAILDSCAKPDSPDAGDAAGVCGREAPVCKADQDEHKQKSWL